MMYHILAKHASEKQAKMLTRDGRTRLRIHALQYPGEKIDEYLESLRRDNPEWTFAKRKIA